MAESALRAALERWKSDESRTTDFLKPMDIVDEAVISAARAFMRAHLGRTVDEDLRWEITETMSVLAARRRYISMPVEEMKRLIAHHKNGHYTRAVFLEGLLRRKTLLDRG